MRKPSTKVAKIAVVALAIPLFGGFATYAAAQVSTKPAPQVVIPGGPGVDDKVGVTHTTVSDDPANHDTTDDSSTTRTTDDKGGVTVVDGVGRPGRSRRHRRQGRPHELDRVGRPRRARRDGRPRWRHQDDGVGRPGESRCRRRQGPRRGHAYDPGVTTPASTPVTIDDKGGKHGSGGHGRTAEPSSSSTAECSRGPRCGPRVRVRGLYPESAGGRCSLAHSAACVRSVTPSCWNTAVRWALTVRSLMPSRRAICLLASPVATSPRHLRLAAG